MGRLEVAVHSGAHLQFCEAMWGPVYEAILNILGSTGTILPVGDPLHGQPNAATFKSVGEEQVTFTWSEPPNSFDKRLDLTDPASWQGVVPVVDFNGTDEEADTPDAAFWDMGNGTSDVAFTAGFWANLDAGNNESVLGKKGGSNTNGWSMGTSRFTIHDNSAGPSATCVRNRDVAPTTGVWHFLVCTYSGVGGASAGNGVIMYEDGAVALSTATNNAAYVAMEDSTVAMNLGFNPGDGVFLNGRLAGGPIGPFVARTVALTADQVARLYQVGRRALALR